jgi:hypothetical protein
MEDRLPGAAADVHEHAVVVEPGSLRRLGHEPQHACGLLVREGGDVLERVDVALGKNEEMGLGERVDVADRDEAVGSRNVVALAGELAEEAVLTRRRQGFPPPRARRRAR